MKISESQYARLLLGASHGSAADFRQEISRFVHLLRRHRKVRQLNKIVAVFSKLYDDEKKALPLKITTARPIGPVQRQTVVAALEKKFKKKVAAEFAVESGVIGGIKISGPDFLIDNTLVSQVNKLSNKL